MTLPPPERLTFNCSADGSRWPYLVQTPEGEPVAILLYLHGHYANEGQGMTEGDYDDAFGKLRRECLRRNWAYVCPWYGGNTWMGPLGEAGMVDLIAILRARWPRAPFFLTGGSMGGSSALVFATRRPDLLAGAAAFCPAGDIEAYYAYALCRAGENPTLANVAAAIRIHYTCDGHSLEEELQARSALRNAERLALPLYLSHGACDALIPVTWVRQLAAKLRKLRYSVASDELSEGDHDAPVRQVDWGKVLGFLSR